MLRKTFQSICLLLVVITTSGYNIYANNYQLKKVVIDAGHGGKDPGTSKGNTREKDIVLKVALKTGELIRQKYPNVEVIYTRSTDKFVNLSERAEIANKNNADLFISIHVNYFEKPEIHGAETYLLGLHRSKENLDLAKLENSVILLEDDYSTRYEGFDPNQPESYIMFELIQNEFLEQSRQFADKVQNHFSREAQMRSRGIKQAGFLVLRQTTMPSVLIELGYLSNQKDKLILESDEGAYSLANSISNAFSEYKLMLEDKNKSTLKVHSTPVSTKEIKADTTTDLIRDISGLDGLWFGVQILSNSTKLDAKDARLKNQKEIYTLFENGSYKYFLCVNRSHKTATSILPDLKKEFQGAFPVAFLDGKKTDYKKALLQNIK